MSEPSEERSSRVEADYGISKENQELLIRLLKSEQATSGNKLPRELHWISALLAEKPYREVEPWTLADRITAFRGWDTAYMVGSSRHHAAWKIVYKHLPKWSAAEWDFKKQDVFYRMISDALRRWQERFPTVVQRPLRQPKKVRNPFMTPVANLRGVERLLFLSERSPTSAETRKRIHDSVRPLLRQLASNVRHSLPLIETNINHCSGGFVEVMVYANFRIADTEVISAAVTLNKHPDGFLVSADITDEDTGRVYYKEAPVMLPCASTDESIDVITSLARKLSERAETIVGVLKKKSM